jgi:hypothetical protein
MCIRDSHYNRLRQKPALNASYYTKKEALAKNNAKQRRYLFNGREKTFSQFLFYRLFYANEKPTILTEGKTDNIYLKTAINMLASSFPSLGKVKTSDTPYELLVRFVEYSERTRFLLELYGGADYLKDFVKGYKMQSKRFAAPKPVNPVIIVVDNDEGPKDLLNYIAKILDAAIYPTTLKLNTDIRKSDFVHIFDNLYIVCTPLGDNYCNTDIEYFFNDTDRLKKYNGKCFNTVGDRNPDKDLSKDAFAKNIVKAQKKDVDFSGLKPLLNRVLQVIAHYNTIK